MDTGSQPVNLKSWMASHPRAVIGFLLVVCLGPFVNKAVHTDDALYVWTAEWIQKHPADCFGFKVNWWSSSIPMWVANWNPPVMSYFLAGVACLFGWNEAVLHLGCLAVAFLALAGVYRLAQMWCERPLLATVIAMFTPVFLVSSTTLMCDVLMLTFWIWALVLWERNLAGGRCWWLFMLAGGLAGLAVLTKYSAVTMLPLLPVLGILRTRKAGWWLLGLAVPLMMLAGYEWMTAKMYGTGLFSNAVAHTHHSREFPDGWGARGIIGLAFAGGCLLPLLLFAPLVWRWQVLLAGGIIIFGMLLGALRWCGNLRLFFFQSENAGLMNHWGFLLQIAFLCAGGLHLLLLTAAEVLQRRSIQSVVLAFWIGSGLFSAIVLNFAINARSLLLVVPAAAILLVRRLEAARGNPVARNWWLWPLIPASAITLSLVFADYQLAGSARTAAEQIAAKYKPAGRQMWFEGHGAFQYYMEKLGGLPIDVERSLLQPGDIVIVPEIGIITPFPPGSVGWVDHVRYTPFSWMNLMGSTENGAAGFYGANSGPVPFAVGKVPDQPYSVVRVFSRVQYDTQPANPQEVQAGDLPSYPNISFAVEDEPMLPGKPEAREEVQLARRCKEDGKIEEAIHHYRSALEADSNNVVALNNLAWILAASSRPELRNGGEAVKLAARAVKLTDARQPVFIGTLAAAYAEAGQFSQAREMTNAAAALNVLCRPK